MQFEVIAQTTVDDGLVLAASDDRDVVVFPCPSAEPEVDRPSSGDHPLHAKGLHHGGDISWIGDSPTTMPSA